MNDPLIIAVFLIVLLLSMSLHEMMHAWTSYWLGDDTAYLMGRLSLNPLHHIDPLLTVALPLLMLLSGGPLIGAARPVQVDFRRLRYGEYGGAIVGMVGPLTNLVIAIVAALIFNTVQPPTGGLAYDLFKITIGLNVGLFVFNSIPWPPLDGSRLLYAFAPRGLQEFMSSVERTGVAGLVMFILVFWLVLGGLIGSIYSSLIHFLAPGLIF